MVVTRNDGKVVAEIIHQDEERTIFHATWDAKSPPWENRWCCRSTKSFRENFS